VAGSDVLRAQLSLSDSLKTLMAGSEHLKIKTALNMFHQTMSGSFDPKEDSATPSSAEQGLDSKGEEGTTNDKRSDKP
jgi:hypothetical protein